MSNTTPETHQAHLRPDNITEEELEIAKQAAAKNLTRTNAQHDIDVGYHCSKCGELVRNKEQTCDCSSN